MEVVSTRAGALPAPLETLKIGKALGKGGFAVVRTGQLKTADGVLFPVAIKVLHPEFSEETSPELRLFKEEADLMLQLNHRNIITAYGLLKLPPNFPGLEGHTAPAYALVLELMEGGSLGRLMVKQLLAGAVPKYTFSQALGWLIDVASALQYLHNGGKDGFPRIHRDVKLENVLLTAGMRTAKLADFGLQRAISNLQHPEQYQQQTAMLVRRSMRTSVNLPRGGPVGPSRLAPSESERTSLRQASNARLQQLQLQPAAGAERRSSPSGFVTATAAVLRGEKCGDATTDELLLPGGSEAVFYAVDNNGLTPVVLPHSPQSQKQPSLLQAANTLPVNAAAVGAGVEHSRLGPQQRSTAGYRVDSVREMAISRRSRSTPQLEQLDVEKEPWPAALVAVASSARDGGGGGGVAAAAASSGGNRVVSGQLLSAGGSGGIIDNSGNNTNALQAVAVRNSISNTSSEVHRSNSALLPGAGSGPGPSYLQVALPPSPVAPASPGRRGLGTGPSQRSLLLGAAGSSPSAARPSPLGPTPSSRRPNSLTDAAPRLEVLSPSAGYSPRGQPRLPAGGSPRGAACGPMAAGPGGRASSVDTVPGTPPSAPPMFSSVNVPGASSVFVSGRQSPGGQTPSPHDGRSPGLAALEAAVLSNTSVRDVLLEPVQLPLQQQEPHRQQEDALTPAPPQPLLPPPPLQTGGGMRPFGSTAPGAFAGAGGFAAATAAAASSGRLQVLTAADAGSGAERGADAPGPVGAVVALSAVLRPTQSAAAGSAVPLVAVNSAARSEYLPAAPSSAAAAIAPRAGTASGMVGGGDRAFVGDFRGSTARISVVTPAAAVPSFSGGCRADEAQAAPTGSGLVSPKGGLQSPHQAQNQQQQLHMADLLHLRLGAQNVSVRSVRSSASGALNRQLVGSAPSSPRLVAFAAARAAAAGGAGAGSAAGGQQEQEAAALALVPGVRNTRTGSVPGSLGAGRSPSGGAKASGQVAEFEEVFSLTGRTGSLMYLAPEAYKNEPYNDKVDVYSLAMLMYELFGRTSISYTHISTKLPAFSRMLCNPDEFAERVAAGYRPPRTNTMAKMPPALWELIKASWHQDPVQRPDIGEVLQALEELVEPVAEVEAGGGRRHLGPAHCGCAIC